MTAIHASRTHVSTTRFERALLDLAARLERAATARAERRAERSVSTVAAQVAAEDARTDARAIGGIGMLPR